MSEDWSAVAKAITERMTALGLNQRELAERSQVALSIVREIAHDTVRRKRAGRTLEALSVALGWHPRHLAAVLLDQRPHRLRRGRCPRTSGGDRGTAHRDHEAPRRDEHEHHHGDRSCRGRP